MAELNGKYTISIIVTNDNDEKLVMSANVSNTNSLAEMLHKIDRKINEYDEDNYKKCYQCEKINHLDEYSIVENNKNALAILFPPSSIIMKKPSPYLQCAAVY